MGERKEDEKRRAWRQGGRGRGQGLEAGGGRVGVGVGVGGRRQGRAVGGGGCLLCKRLYKLEEKAGL